MKLNKKPIFIFVLCVLILLSGIFFWSPACFSQKKNVIIPVDVNNLKHDVKYLTEIVPARNFRYINSLNLAAEYIKSRLEKTNCKVHYQLYTIDNHEYKNVIASYFPNYKNRIIIGAHYDVCGNQPGADDNASGVAGLIEIGRLIDSLKPTLNYGIDLIAYSTEEPPYFATSNMGSAFHANSLKKQVVKIKLMICLEMIGYFSEMDDSQDYPVSILKWFYPTKANFILIAGNFTEYLLVRKLKMRMKEASNIDVCSLNAPAFFGGIDFSDHRNYWNNGYCAVMITNTAFYRNKNYHEKTDSYGSLDFIKMAEVVKGVYWMAINQ
jgi:hypothetical protein